MQNTPQNRIRQALAALRNAMTRAAKHDDPAAKATTLLQGILTAVSWLDGSHEALRSTPGTEG